MANHKAVKTISYKGNPYVEVKERVAAVHEREAVFEVVDTVFTMIEDRVLCKAYITVDGKRYAGTAEAKVKNARANTPDATNPFECAETSAVGRALGFAGFGSVDSIASFDEIARGQTREELAAGTQNLSNKYEPPTNPDDDPTSVYIPEPHKEIQSPDMLMPRPKKPEEVLSTNEQIAWLKKHKLVYLGQAVAWSDLVARVNVKEIEAGNVDLDALVALGNGIPVEIRAKTQNLINTILRKNNEAIGA